MSNISNYPKGFRRGIALRGMPVLETYGGNVYWVDSNGGGGGRGTFNHPCLTLGAGYDLCTADNGDIVMIKPGHAETITATIAFDTAGVAVIGLGNGTKRPQFTCNHAAADDNTIEVTAAGQYMENLEFLDGHSTAALSSGEVYIDISADGDDFTCVNCRFEQADQVMEAVTVGAANDVSFIGCEWVATSGDVPDNAIVFEGAAPRARILNCIFDYSHADVDKGAVLFEASADSYALIKNCEFYGVGALPGQGPVVVVSQGGFSNDYVLIADCVGQVVDLSDLFAANVSNQLTVINSYFGETGTSVYPRSVLNANQNWTAPAATAVV